MRLSVFQPVISNVLYKPYWECVDPPVLFRVERLIEDSLRELSKVFGDYSVVCCMLYVDCSAVLYKVSIGKGKDSGMTAFLIASHHFTSRGGFTAYVVT